MKTNTNCETLGRQIRAKRKSLGYTQGQLAQMASCSQRFISELERGKATVELGKVLDILDAMGCSFSLCETTEGRPGSRPLLKDYL